MQVKVAESAGFCFGVKRAVDLVYEETEKSRGRVYTMGPIIRAAAFARIDHHSEISWRFERDDRENKGNGLQGGKCHLSLCQEDT